jgi:flagellar basal body-associated protein FliL
MPQEQTELVKSSGTKGWILLLGVMIVALAIAAGAFVVFLRPQDPLAVTQVTTSPDDLPPALSWPLSDFVVNLAPPDENTFLKLDLALAIIPTDDQHVKLILKELDARRDELKDLVNMILTSKTKSELATTQGKENVKSELVRRINEVLRSGEIQSVYFRQFTFQEL